MRVALVHDYLNQYGGAERVLEAFCEMFPEAPIYTLFYDQEKTLGRFEGKIKATSFLDKRTVIQNHRYFIPLMPLAVSRMNLGQEYDVILSSTAGYGKGIRYSGDAKHISYCHTPLRYAWEYSKYFNWSPIQCFFSAPAFWYLRKWDWVAAQKPDTLLANSKHIAAKIKNYYQREAEVVYPPVDLKKFYRDPKIKNDNYFLAAGRLLRYKRFDLIVQAFNKLNFPLIIVGEGPELENLKSIANHSKIYFLPFVSDDKLRFLYNEAEALIFPQEEDFGLTAAEAQACGTPVIALNKGGAREIVEDGVTGVLFDQQTVDDLILAVRRFLLSSFDKRVIRESAMKFSQIKFKSKILKIIKTYLNNSFQTRYL